MMCVCTKMTHEMGQFVQFILTEIHANNSCTIILFFYPIIKFVVLLCSIQKLMNLCYRWILSS